MWWFLTHYSLLRQSKCDMPHEGFDVPRANKITLTYNTFTLDMLLPNAMSRWQRLTPRKTRLTWRRNRFRPPNLNFVQIRLVFQIKCLVTFEYYFFPSMVETYINEEWLFVRWSLLDMLQTKIGAQEIYSCHIQLAPLFFVFLANQV